MLQALLDRAVEGGAKLTYGGEEHAIYSVDPPETAFGFTYHSHLIPPFRPDTCLILGYGAGTVAKLIYKIWGDVKVTGVDKETYETGFLPYQSFLVKEDALKYVQSCAFGIFKKKFDYVVVDVWDGLNVPAFVFSKEFAKRLASITKKMIGFNIPKENANLLQIYIDQFDFNFVRSDVVGTGMIGFFAKWEY